MTAIEIIKKYLKDNGYDGLFWSGACSCKIDELIICGESCAHCEPGYFIPKESEDFDHDYDYMIGPKKYRAISIK